MNAYIFQADIYCSDCARNIREMLPLDARASDDSDSYPQGPYANGGGESDVPEHCAECGTFLENPLTSEGYDYLRNECRSGPIDGYNDTVKEWLAYYDIDADEDEEV
jgi:hypothetical protein